MYSIAVIQCTVVLFSIIVHFRNSRPGGGGGVGLWLELCSSLSSLVPRPHPPKGGKGSGDIGADSWCCKLSNHVIICIGLYRSTCSHMMVRTTKKRPPMSPDPFLACVMGSGNETTHFLNVNHHV